MDAGEVERLKSQKLKLEEAISTFEDNLRAVKSELKNIEDQGAKLEKQRVFFFLLLVVVSGSCFICKYVEIHTWTSVYYSFF